MMNSLHDRETRPSTCLYDFERHETGSRSLPCCSCLLCSLTLLPLSLVQFAFNTLQRVSPVSHGVCNVIKRIAIIFSSVIFFNQVNDVSSVGDGCMKKAVGV